MNYINFKSAEIQETPAKETLCGFKNVFLVVILGELFAIILAIAEEGFASATLNNLALTSIYIQWNGLLGLLLLCSLSPLVKDKSLAFKLTMSWLVLMLMIVGFSYATYYLLSYYDLFELIKPFDLSAFVLRNLLIGGIISGLAIRYLYIQQQWKNKIKAEAEAKLQLLQARIRPHFLFNSMNTIASLCVDNPFLAEKTTLDLAELFRPLIKNDLKLTSWKDELSLSEKYLAIEKLRFSDRMEIVWHIGNVPNDALIPTLTLQPLLENAIHYGIESSIKGGTVEIKASYNKNQIAISIENTIPENKSSKEGNQIAINNIQQRLKAHYGNDATLMLTQKPGKFVVNLSIPYIKFENN